MADQPSLEDENELLRARNEKLLDKMRTHREKARSALQLAEKTASQNAVQIANAKKKIDELHLLVKSLKAERDEAVERERRKLQQLNKKDQTSEQNTKLVKERDAAKKELAKVAKQRDQAIKERDEADTRIRQAFRKKEQALKQKADYMLKEREDILKQRNEAMAQRDEAMTKLQNISNCLQFLNPVQAQSRSKSQSQPILVPEIPDSRIVTGTAEAERGASGGGLASTKPSRSEFEIPVSEHQDQEDVPMDTSIEMEMESAISIDDSGTFNYAEPVPSFTLELGRPRSLKRKRVPSKDAIVVSLLRLPRPKSSSDRSALLRWDNILPVQSVSDRFAACLQSNIVSRSDLVCELIDAVGAAVAHIPAPVSSEKQFSPEDRSGIQRIADIIQLTSRRDEQVTGIRWSGTSSIQARFFQKVQEVVSKQPLDVPLSQPIHIAMALCLSLFCKALQNIAPLRALCFDVIRLRPCVELAFLHSLAVGYPDAFHFSHECILGSALRLVLCSAFADDSSDETFSELKALLQCSDNLLDEQSRVRQTDEVVQTAIDSLSLPTLDSEERIDTFVLSDLEMNCARSMELISLSQGWSWACKNVLQPLWTRLQKCASPAQCSAVVYTIGLIGRTVYAEAGPSPKCPYFHTTLSRLEALLPGNGCETNVPGCVQFATAEAMILMAGNRVSRVRSLYRWFVEVPQEQRINIPSSLRADLQFLGRRVSCASLGWADSQY